MDPDQLKKIIQEQKELAADALSVKGEKDTDRLSRRDLLHEHDMFVTNNDRNSSDETHLRIYVMNGPYPPSKVSVSELKPILIADLRIETHHRGRIIFLRAIAVAGRVNGIMNVVEDTSGVAERLEVYNVSLDSDPKDIIGKGKVYAVKEPYYSMSIDGAYLIRVDHPSDLMHLPSGHDLMPQVFASQPTKHISAQIQKNQGNLYYKQKAYQLAIDSYDWGIRACTAQEQDLKADLYRNRAQANLYLGRYEPALRDATRSVEHLSPGERTASLNCKALYRAGRALYALRRFDEAQGMYERALDLSPSDSDALRAIDEVKMRIEEATTGVYDMESIIAATWIQSTHANVASYVKDVAVRQAGTRGRGLFAEKDFKVGEMIMSEKAFEISPPVAPPNPMFHVLLDMNKERDLSGKHGYLFHSLVDKLRHNSSLAPQFLDLCSGDHTSKCNASEVDGNTVIDIYEVLAIMESNSFSTSRPEEGFSGGIGIWLTASYINHACNANATRMFLGDMILLRAVRDIVKGEEIYISYISLNTGYENAQKQLQDTWGFKCSCTICAAEGKVTKADRELRRARLHELMALIEANPHHRQGIVSQRITQQAEAMYANLVETYSPAIYMKSPRVDLVGPSLWIATSFTIRNDLVRAKPACLEVLRNCAVFVTFSKDSITIHHGNGVTSQLFYVMDTAMHLSMIHAGEGKINISAQFKSFAQSMWLMIYPTSKGFTKRYGGE